MLSTLTQRAFLDGRLSEAGSGNADPLAHPKPELENAIDLNRDFWRVYMAARIRRRPPQRVRDTTVLTWPAREKRTPPEPEAPGAKPDLDWNSDLMGKPNDVFHTPPY